MRGRRSRSRPPTECPPRNVAAPPPCLRLAEVLQIHEDVQVDGGTRNAVDAEYVRTNDQEPGVSGEQFGECVPKVVLHSSRRCPVRVRTTLATGMLSRE